MKRARRLPPLKLYRVTASYHHLTQVTHPGYAEASTGVVDRLPFPVVASSKRHALTLAQEMLRNQAELRGDARLRDRIRWTPLKLGDVHYVGPCTEPGR